MNYYGWVLAWGLLGTMGAVRAEDFASRSDNSVETWKRYAVRGIELGTPMAALQGFTCTERAKKHEYNANCYKIMDERCRKGRCELKVDKVFGNQWFELNGAKAQLDFMTVTLTDTDSSLVYQIHLAFGPRQLLAPDSTLGKALIAKYGDSTDQQEPNSSDPAGGGQMRWYNKVAASRDLNAVPNVDVNCSDAESTQCRLAVMGMPILDMERDKQKDINEKRVKASQPAKAPEL